MDHSAFRELQKQIRHGSYVMMVDEKTCQFWLFRSRSDTRYHHYFLHDETWSHPFTEFDTSPVIGYVGEDMREVILTDLLFAVRQTEEEILHLGDIAEEAHRQWWDNTQPARDLFNVTMRLAQ